jgi:hypothetical protein
MERSNYYYKVVTNGRIGCHGKNDKWPWNSKSGYVGCEITSRRQLVRLVVFIAGVWCQQRERRVEDVLLTATWPRLAVLHMRMISDKGHESLYIQVDGVWLVCDWL